MTGRAWTVVAPDDLADAASLAPVYFASDGELALYNDYRRGISILVPGGKRGEGRRSVWAGPPPGAVAPYPLAAREKVEGYGTFTFPYGPVSMGVPEAGRFDLLTYGERILELTPLGGYKSRRILPSLVGTPVLDAALRVERIAGNFSAAHVAAFLSAVENAGGVEVAATELWTRAVAQELQRLYNHLYVLARVAEAASQNVGAAQTHALAEELLRLQGRTFGHRWMFGGLLPGGPPRRLDPIDRADLGQRLQTVSEGFEALWELFLGSRTFVDRIQSTCPVGREAAVRWGAVGPTLRATGVPWDDRLRVPIPPYTDLFVEVAHEPEGDALARLLVRAAEVRASLLLLEQMLDRWPNELRRVGPTSEPVAPGRGIGRVESPSGDLVYDVSVTDGRLTAIGTRSASDANWPLFSLGMRDSVFTDFHFAFESFGLVFAETDR
jgi:Ni,Fe-hydrogenase III large subunit